MYPSALNDEVAQNGVVVAGEGFNEIFTVARIQLSDYLPDARKLACDQLLRPAFQSLGHNGVIGVGNAGGNNVHCLVPS